MKLTLFLVLPSCVGAIAAAQTVPSYDFSFATISAVGNMPYAGPDPVPFSTGRGRVDHEYRISRLELTTSQYLEFVNAAAAHNSLDLGWALWWGAEIDPTAPTIRYRLINTPDAGQRQVTNITWREAAMYCNWLHNHKSADHDAILNGAYDTSTFGQGPDGLSFTDQLTHHPDARFWIPTYDEWMKAAYYDPNRNGPGQGGWWLYGNASDIPLVPGLPGAGTTNAGLILQDAQQRDMIVGAYQTVQSPWGLLDVSGGASEWTEESQLFPNEGNRTRIAKGAYAGDLAYVAQDAAWGAYAYWPYFSSTTGLRIASSIPAPGVLTVVSVGIVLIKRRRK
jgi:formylglycine-generating enzyme required for sulfatase activity